MSDHRTIPVVIKPSTSLDLKKRFWQLELFNPDGSSFVRFDGGYLQTVEIDPEDYRSPTILPESPTAILQPWCLFGFGGKLDESVIPNQVKLLFFVDGVVANPDYAYLSLSNITTTVALTSFDGTDMPLGVESGNLQLGLVCPTTVPRDLRIEINTNDPSAPLDGYTFSLNAGELSTDFMSFTMNDVAFDIEAAIETALSDAGISGIGTPSVQIEDVSETLRYVHIYDLDETATLAQMESTPSENGYISGGAIDEIPERSEPFTIDTAILRVVDLSGIPLS